MGQVISITGKSGTGKTTSLNTLNPTETVVINVSGQPLPIKGWSNKYTGKLTEGGNYLNSSNPETIKAAITYIADKRPDIKYLFVDDAQFIMAFEFMDKAKEKGFEKFVNIGVSMAGVLKAAREAREDLMVFFSWHPEETKDGSYKMKSIGAMLDNYLTLEGLFNVVLYSRVIKTQEGIKYQFVTNSDGEYPAKSPMGMFEELYVPNDLSLVIQKIKDYETE